MLGFMEHYDVILCPTCAYPAPPHGMLMSEALRKGTSYTGAYNLTGWPCFPREGEPFLDRRDHPSVGAVLNQLRGPRNGLPAEGAFVSVPADAPEPFVSEVDARATKLAPFTKMSRTCRSR